jgi:RimJ/RimL family protein N-acetyltransferase
MEQSGGNGGDAGFGIPARLPAHSRTTGGRRFVVREYHEEDREELDLFYLRFEPKRAAQGLPPSGADRIARWLDAVLAGGIHLLVELDNVVAGHALLVPMEPAATAEYAIFLDQEIRGQGVGTEVNRIAVEAARAAGLTRLWLSVEPHNRAAIRSYEKVGFRFRPGTVLSMEAEMELELRA